MSSCGSCSGGCGGCARELTLTRPEIDMLMTLAQIPFLPVCRRPDEDTPVYLEEDAYSLEAYSQILRLLEKKGLVDIDYRQPLKGVAADPRWPVQGSMALTARGQQVVELLEIQGAIGDSGSDA